jgi:diguanylate cyclase (GGDEF)-like protein/PAS domain S-box-containing protein
MTESPVGDAKPTSPARWFGSKRRPFVFWLLVVQLAAALPLLAFSTLLIQRIVATDEQESIEQLEQKALVAADAVGREAARGRTKLELLVAQDVDLVGDMSAMRRLAIQLVQVDQAVAGVSAVDRTGQLVLATDRPEGTPLPKISLSTGAEVLFGRKDDASGSPPDGFNDMSAVGVAASWKVKGDVRYILMLSVKPEVLSNLLREQRWGNSGSAAIVDQNLNIVARSRESDTNFREAATSSIQRFVRTGVGTDFSTTKDGVQVATAVVPVPGTLWWLVAGLPRAELGEQGESPVHQLLIGGGLVVLFGMGFSTLLAHRLNRTVRAIAAGDASSAALITEFHALGLQQLVLDNELVGMVRLRDGRSVWHNRALERIFGYTHDELPGHSPRLMHLNDESFSRFDAEVRAVLDATGQQYRTQLELVRKDGRRVWADLSGVRLPDGETLWMIVDISAMKAEHDRMERLAFSDNLTGLPNRSELAERLRHAIMEAKSNGTSLVVGFLDLDGFKKVNDTHGHAVGDRLLKVIAERLQGCVRPQDTIARIGGDEFVVLLTRVPNQSEAEAVLSRIRDAISEPVNVMGRSCHVTASMGTAYMPEDGDEADGLLAKADSRMYRDKEAGRRNRPAAGDNLSVASS